MLFFISYFYKGIKTSILGSLFSFDLYFFLSFSHQLFGGVSEDCILEKMFYIPNFRN